jgi:quaternary ammonium compound-resistance protein SugE
MPITQRPSGCSSGLNMSWLILILAAVAEAIFGIAAYYAKGFSVFWPSVLAVVAGTITAILLSYCMKSLPLGLAFAIWSGLAAAGTTIYGMIMLGENRSALQIGLIAVIILASCGLKISSAS